jgi:hypothetical protein
MSSALQDVVPSPAQLQAEQNNTATPLLLLPPELIVDILLLLLITPLDCDANESHAFVDAEDAFIIDSTWTRMMLLCSHIRAVALGTPSLWSYIDFSSHPNWVDICHQRAGNHPLVLLNLNNEDDSDINTDGNMITKMIPQACVIRMKFPLAIPENIRDTLKKPLPLLRVLDLGTSNDNFPFTTLSESTNNLTRLTLSEVWPDTALVLPLLTHLSLHMVFLVDHMDLLEFISRSPLLEVIVIDTTPMEDPDIADSEVTLVVQCPHLRILALMYESFAVAWYFLRALPDPKDGLYVDMTKFGGDRIVELPPSPGSADEHLLHRVQNFWSRHSKNASMGPGTLRFLPNNSNPRVTFGEPFNRDSSSPSLYLDMSVHITGGDDLLAEITRASYWSSNHTKWPSSDDAGVGPSPEDVMISGPISDDDLLQLEHWMRMRMRHGHKPVDVIFWPPSIDMCDEDAHIKRCQQVARLRKAIYVDTVYYYCRDSPGDPDSTLYVSTILFDVFLTKSRLMYVEAGTTSLLTSRALRTIPSLLSPLPPSVDLIFRYFVLS